MEVCNEDDGVVWSKSEKVVDTSDEDAWDDTALVKAYDKAIAQLRGGGNVGSSSSLSQLSGGNKIKNKNKNIKNTTRKKWKIGEQCLAMFDDDCLYYEATVLSANNNTCRADVKFSYYGNEENVSFDKLLPIHNKNRMKVAWNNSHKVKSEKSCDGNDNELPGIGEWNVGDVCYVVNNKTGTYQKAVINSFTSSQLCHITITNSNQKREVKISQLHETVPSQQTHKPSSTHTDSHNLPRFHPELPMHVPPLPPPPPPPPFYLPEHPPHSHLSDINYPHTNMFNGDDSFSKSKLPQCPPIPVLPEYVTSGKEEALANMLMSWYMSGYHTGYYQGLRHEHHDNQTWSVKRKNRRQRDKKQT